MIGRTFLTLRADQRGASAIELALAAPILAAMVIGVTDLSRAYSMKLMMEQAAQRTIEKVEQQKSVSNSYNSALTAEATSAMSDAGYSTGNTITPDSWVECSTNGSSWARQSNFTDACSPGQLTARYVSVSISRSYSPMFRSRAWPGADSNGNLTITGWAEVRIQ